MASLTSSISELRKVFAGELVEPASSDYDDVRRLHNGAIDKRPALVARCQGTADIADAMKLARAKGSRLPCAAADTTSRTRVRRRRRDDRPVADAPGQRRSAEENCVGRRRRHVADFNRETQQFGLATTGGVVSSTGVAGLTLGGGFGWLMPRFGMALDNLRAVKLVLADGSVVLAARRESRSVLGRARRRRQLRRRRHVRVPVAQRRPDGDRRAGRASRPRAKRRAAVFPRRRAAPDEVFWPARC